MLNQPLQTKHFTLRNRIVLPPLATRKAMDELPGEELVEYYRARARGTALVILEHGYVMPEGMAYPGQLCWSKDSVVEAYRMLTEAVHSQGAKIFAQLSHAGAKARDTAFRTVGPSAIAFRDGEVPAALTKEEIQDVVRAFAAAARRAKASGFDGVEIHSAHGYLLNQFYSPLMNHRTDEYAADTMENRTRIHREVIRAVRDAVGEDYTVAIRFGACDYLEGGSELADIPAALRAFLSAGADILDMTGGMGGYTRPGHTEAGYFKELGHAAKSAVSAPVILTGGVTEPREAEALLQEGAADLIGVGRAFMKDADWALRALGECGQ